MHRRARRAAALPVHPANSGPLQRASPPVRVMRKVISVGHEVFKGWDACLRWSGAVGVGVLVFLIFRRVAAMLVWPAWRIRAINK